MAKLKVVLAYSGGLDTSVIVKWLTNKGYHEICFVGNVGQKEDFAAIEQKALATGALKVYVEDLMEKFVTYFIFRPCAEMRFMKADTCWVPPWHDHYWPGCRLTLQRNKKPEFWKIHYIEHRKVSIP